MATNGHYRPFQIARPSADHVRLEVVSEGLDRLAEMTDPLAIVGVVGAFHSGKSFLLNALLWSLQQRTARTSVNSDAHSDTHEQRPSSNQFAVADQVSPKTMGLWLLETDVRLRDGSRVVLLDSEGFLRTMSTKATMPRFLRLLLWPALRSFSMPSLSSIRRRSSTWRFSRVARSSSRSRTRFVLLIATATPTIEISRLNFRT
jgi:hypothetical protein